MAPCVLFLSSLLLISTISPSHGINQPALRRIGAIVSSVKQLKFYSKTKPNYIIVKLLPTINLSKSNCNLTSINRYKESVIEIIKPLADNIDNLNQKLLPKNRRKRMAGVAIGLAALGVAAAAQATAAVALVEARKNTQMIQSLADSIQDTNAAVQAVNIGLQNSAVAIQAIQNQINNVINPALDRLNCEVLDAQIASILNLYLIKSVTIFQNQLTNPALQQLSIQMLSIVMQDTAKILGNFTIGDKFDQHDLLGSGLITGQVVGVNLTNLQLIIAAFIPSIAPLPQAYIIDLISITISVNDTEAVIQIPERIMEHGSSIYQFGGKQCVYGQFSAYCPFSDAVLMTQDLQLCMKGNIEHCIFSSVLGSFPNRFASVDGVFYANCKYMSCACSDPLQVIHQDDSVNLMVIDSSVCRSLTLGHVTFPIIAFSNVSYQMKTNISIEQMIVTSPLDLSTELKQINNSVNIANTFLDSSNRALKTSIFGTSSQIILIVLLIFTCLLILYVIFLTYIIKILIKEVKRLRDGNSRTGSKLSFINPDV
ncbi:fusion protein [Tuhoko virus 2]|uniref:Fusion glycoprotein F0 n=1 Tax=Tuhoko virus 2 TaxID=798073 RepID=D8WJ33_9MONO|nr:fusion protein [Tuhoko virus 2]ADI80720.1 fusion protein [Tuhoko virus 2]